MPKLSYQLEALDEAWDDLLDVLEHYWGEVRGAQEAQSLDLDRNVYDIYETNGSLLLLTARDEDELVGFVAMTVSYHHHHQSDLCGFFDAWYVVPAYRRAGVGQTLVGTIEALARDRGVVRLYAGSSTKLDVSTLFERMGWSETEILYSKTLGD